MNTEKASSAVPWALLLDACVIIANFFLIDYLARELGALVRLAWLEDDAESARLLGLALLATFVAQMVGAVLKGAPMHARLAARRAGRDKGAGGKTKAWARLRDRDIPARNFRFFGALLFLHFVLSTLIVFSIPVLLGVSFNVRVVLLVIPFMFIPTALVWGALEPPKIERPAPPGPLTHPLTETVANLCLFSYALINQLFWSALLVSNTPLRSLGEVPDRALQAFVFLIPVTAMYFFAPRILFLAEELDDPRTRLSMKLALASIALRWIVGGGAGGGGQ
jgi:hypothetical protein